MREQPSFAFDPDSIGSNFQGYDRTVALGYVPLERRVVAPVPGKADALREPFIRSVYRKAEALVRSSGHLVAIGYRFNEYDRASYHPILAALAKSPRRDLALILPEAEVVAARLSSEYSEISIEPIAETFRSWVEKSFPGVNSASD